MLVAAAVTLKLGVLVLLFQLSLDEKNENWHNSLKLQSPIAAH